MPENTLTNLREPFTVDQVKQRPGGGGRQLDYVPIETVLERLLTVSPDYSWEARVVAFEDGIAVVEGHLTIGDKKAYGVGAMQNRDADMAVKSANSEAMKNAAKNGFGVALELWDEDHRAELEEQRSSASSLDTLKNRVADIAVAEGADRTAVAIAEHFGVTLDELQDPEVLERLVAQEEVVPV